MMIIIQTMINNNFISLRGGGHYLPCGSWSSSFPSCHFKVSCVTLSAFSHAASLLRKRANRRYCNHLLLVMRPDDAYPRHNESSSPYLWSKLKRSGFNIAASTSKTSNLRVWHFYHHAQMSAFLVPHQGAAHKPPTVLEWTLIKNLWWLGQY